jgi:hypothetical protein
MWICRTTKIKLSAEGFALAHQVHHQRRTVFEEEGDGTVEKDCQFSCLNFSYKKGVVRRDGFGCLEIRIISIRIC